MNTRLALAGTVLGASAALTGIAVPAQAGDLPKTATTAPTATVRVDHAPVPVTLADASIKTYWRTATCVVPYPPNPTAQLSVKWSYDPLLKKSRLRATNIALLVGPMRQVAKQYFGGVLVSRYTGPWDADGGAYTHTWDEGWRDTEHENNLVRMRAEYPNSGHGCTRDITDGH